MASGPLLPQANRDRARSAPVYCLEAEGMTMQLTLSRKCTAMTSALASMVAMVFSLSSGSVLAQEEEQLEEITVTGSRIARDPNLSGARPMPVDAPVMRMVLMGSHAPCVGSADQDSPCLSILDCRVHFTPDDPHRSAGRRLGAPL